MVSVKVSQETSQTVHFVPLPSLENVLTHWSLFSPKRLNNNSFLNSISIKRGLVEQANSVFFKLGSSKANFDTSWQHLVTPKVIDPSPLSSSAKNLVKPFH